MPLLREEEVPGVMCRDECLLTCRAEKGCVRSLRVCVEAGCDENKFGSASEPSTGWRSCRKRELLYYSYGELAYLGCQRPAVRDLMNPIATKLIPS